MLATLEPTDLALVPPPGLVARLAKHADQLRMLPAVATEALELAKNPECSISEFAAVVERDVKLAADMLKIANSALYSPPKPIMNLHRAVLRLGFRECQYLIMTASITSLMNRISLKQQWIRGVLWRHSFNTALLAIHLNRSFHLGFQGEEFTAGLMHDFGRTLMAVAVPEQFEQIDPMDFDESPHILKFEHELIGTDHCRLGAWYAVQQELPDPLPEVLLRHHHPELAREGQKLTALIAVADHMANHLQRFEKSAGYEPAANPFWPILAKFADSHFERHFIETAPALMEEAQRDAENLMQV
jgi:HD-like signal output (HDOD) protein